MQSRIITFLMLLVLAPVFIFGQSEGRIKGLVKDAETGEALIGANVLITGSSMGAATDIDGNFTILNVAAGVYEVKASYLGYQSQIIQNVRVNGGLTTDLSFVLNSADISTETVVVVAEKQLIKKDATSSIRTVTSDQIDNLPVRGVNNIVALQAGVNIQNGEVHIRGGRTDEVGYYLEGVSIVNPLSGTRAVTLGNDAIEEVQVEAGGFSVEYGGSNAGIIRSQLRSGGNEFHASAEYITDNIGFASKDDFYSQNKRLGAYWYGKNEASFSVSGPLVSNKVKFFYNLNYGFDRSGAKRGYPGFDYGYIGDGQSSNPIYNDSLYLFYPNGVRRNQKSQSYTHSGTVDVDLKSVRLRFGGVYTIGTSDVGGSSIFNILNSRYSESESSNGSFNFKMSHVLSDKLFYKVTLGYFFQNNETTDPFLGSDYWSYGDSVANAKAGNNWVRRAKEIDQWKSGGLTGDDTRYFQPTPYSIYGWNFAADGALAANYFKSKYSGLTGRADFTWTPNKNHLVKAGIDYKQSSVSRWAVGGQGNFAQKLKASLDADPTQTVDEAKNKILYTAGVNNYGYDVQGNEATDGFYAPHKPVEMGLYVSDKIELNSLVLNIGLRWDYFDTDNLKYVDKTKPELAVSDVWNSGKLLAAGFEDVPTYSILSPRINAAFPVTDKTVFRAGFGKFVQMPSLNQAYLGYHRLAYEMGQSFFFSSPTGADVGPIKKTHYEIGFTQELASFLAVELTGYYDDINGQIFFDIQDTDPNSVYKSYNTKVNGDFATTKGVEMVFNMRRFHRVSGNLSFTYQDGRGTGSYPNSNSGIVGAPLDGVTVFRPNYVSPLTYSKPIMVSFYADYRFGNNDGGFLQNSGVSLLGQYDSGHPFTRGIGGANMETDARFRQPVEPLNASNTPPNFNVDLKIDKTFKLTDRLGLNVNFRVLNLFDTRNVLNVYSRSGAADDDGYLADPQLGGQLLDTYGAIYRDLYQSLNIDYNGFYGGARQILFGIRLEY